MKVLLIGSGGREHALAWKLSQSSKLSRLYIAPGNAGTLLHGENVDIGVNDFERLGSFSLQNQVDMVVVGPEEPLVNGLHDYFLSDSRLKTIPVIGPKRHGAMLEGSKDFAKEFMIRNGIPTARYLSVTAANTVEGKAFLQTLNPPYVLKADGLAAGKGVVILNDLQEAVVELEAMLGGKFGNAGNTVVIEEFLEGIELSVFILTDGQTYKLLPEAKDYKRIGEGDTGPNTGGMGAVSPVSFANPGFMKKVEERVIIPTMEGLKQESISYKGFIFIGLMNCQGEPYVIEYNVRLGDPETEAVVPRIESDLLDLFTGVASGKLNECLLVIRPETVTTVMMVSDGYPGSYEKGKFILNLDKTNDCLVFHAGTCLQHGSVVTNGGRVIAVSAHGKNKTEALTKCYANTSLIKFDGAYYRSDIGFDL